MHVLNEPQALRGDKLVCGNYYSVPAVPPLYSLWIWIYHKLYGYLLVEIQESYTT
jgi:hypothetical protein